MIVFIQNMITPRPDYFRYYPYSSDLNSWGLWVSGSGIATIAAGQTYPPQGHPSDHEFDNEKGRILKALQLVFISDGSGWFEAGDHGCKRIEKGCFFLLLPGIRHSYQPCLASGWREEWVEIQGPSLGPLLSQHPEITGRIILRIEECGQLEQILGTIHNLAQDEGATRPELSAEAFRCLAHLAKEQGFKEKNPFVGRAIFKAERFLAENYHSQLDMPSLARRVGLSYSNFRRSFRQLTGLSPWQYVIELRLKRARKFLNSGEHKLDEIAERIGFSSGFHLSNSFRKAFGISPSAWRKANKNQFQSPTENSKA